MGSNELRNADRVVSAVMARKELWLDYGLVTCIPQHLTELLNDKLASNSLIGARKGTKKEERSASPDCRIPRALFCLQVLIHLVATYSSQ